MEPLASSQFVSPYLSAPSQVQTNAYTDLNSLNAIKNEDNQDEALKKVAKQFESLFVHELLKNMRSANSVFEENNFLDGKESKFFRDMYDQQLSVSLSERGMGLSDVLYRQLQSSYGGEGITEGNKATSTAVQFGTDHAPKMHPSISMNTHEATTKYARSEPIEHAFKTPEAFVESVLPMVKKATSNLGMDPLIMVAQSALETGWGKFVIKDELGQTSHNLFNIKADSSWKGDKVSVSTIEYRDGVPVKEQAFFRKYESIEESVEDFLSFITSNPRYQQAIDVIQDGKQFVNKLQQSGYATDPQYANKIISVFQRLSNSINGSGGNASAK